ncbi:MAG: hypothetical protein JW820_10440 [Spirochaetales bacterium]|nr:hypothetical protein [Spirochaetales bacterium]
MREVQLDPRLHARALSACAAELPVDGIYINLCLGRDQPCRLSEGTYQLDDALTLAIPENDVLSSAGTEITSLDDPRFGTAELYHPGMLETFRLISPRIRETAAVVVGVTGTFSQVAFLYGVAETMIAILDRPEEVERALDRRHSVAIRQVRELAAAGAEFIWIGEGLGSGSLISPAQYRRFVLPYEQSLAEEIARSGASSILHICGNVTAALPDIAASGVDGFDLDYPVDLSTALDTLLPAMAVKGNIDPGLFLPGAEARLQAACRQAIDTAYGRKGFILSTGCLVPRDSSLRGFEIVADCCREPYRSRRNAE